MTSRVFKASIVLEAAALALACSANPLVVGRLIEAGSPSACASAGGTCVLSASGACATEAPTSAQDCNTSDIPIGAGGARCCFTFQEAGPDRDVGPADATATNDDGGHSDSSNNDGGNNDGGGPSQCASVGGACLHANAQCARGAPAAAQDCNNPPNPVGDFCCLALTDAGPGPDAGPADGGPGSDDGGNGDSGGTSPACAAAGGTCIDPTVICPIDAGAPPNAQDCPFPAPFCCITKL
jgi:hypothetical protein